jgi:hypothetical protein
MDQIGTLKAGTARIPPHGAIGLKGLCSRMRGTDSTKKAAPTSVCEDVRDLDGSSKCTSSSESSVKTSVVPELLLHVDGGGSSEVGSA